jgi:hypothetical protein
VTRLAKIAALAASLLLAGPASAALAGPSGKLDFKNATDGSVTWSAAPLACMYSYGESGSRLNDIDGLRQAPQADSDGYYVESMNTGNSGSADDQVALLQGWLIGPQRDGLTRTRMREASRELRGELGGFGKCVFRHSTFGLLVHDGPKFAAAVVRVSGCSVICTTSFSIQKQTGNGLTLAIGGSDNPTVTVSG